VIRKRLSNATNAKAPEKAAWILLEDVLERTGLDQTS
jgi:hypothetical protein